MNNKNKILDSWPTPNFTPRENQIKALEWLEKQDAKYIILELPVGCHLKGTQILMYDGTLKSVENIKINDLLMGKNSTPRKVLELHSGREMMYHIIPNKGESFVVNENHILSLISTKETPSKYAKIGNEIINISVKEYLNKNTHFKNLYKLYRANEIKFNTNNILKIDPYLMGLYLGDGYSGNGRIEIASADKEISNLIYEQASNLDMQIRINNPLEKCSGYCFTMGNKAGINKPNLLLEILKKYKLYNRRSGDKFIPHEYKTASINDRYKLLAGLLDSDGYLDVKSKKTFNIVTKSDKLKDDISFVCASLGLLVTCKLVTGSGKYKNRTYNRLLISGKTEKIPTLLPRKKAIRSVGKHKRATIHGFKIEKYGIDDYCGFQVDVDNLYIMGNFIVTHNSGKSILGLNYSKYLSNNLSNSFILTPQIVLQLQYETDFKTHGRKFLASLHGKGNYKCKSKNATCNVGTLIKPRCNNCPFADAKKEAVDSANTVLNYKLALTSFLYTQTFKKRNLMIMDEAHTLERHLVDFDSVDITYARCKKYDINFIVQRDIEDAMVWVKETYLPKIEDILNDMENDYEYLYEKAGSEISKKELNKLKELDELGGHVCEVMEMSIRTIDYLNENFVLVHDKTMFQFKRLTGAYSFKKILEPMANRFLFMSSTILNKTAFCNDLGIEQKDTAFLSLESDFPVENRPIYYMPVMKMNASWNKPEQVTDRKLMIERIIALLDIHKDESGMLHTANYQVAMWLVKKLQGAIPHEIYHHNPNDDIKRNDAITGFIERSEPAILISPSCTEGLDLKEDLARFAITVKTPFGYLGDQWIKRRMEMSTEWYRRRAMTDIIQGGGRIVRSAEDEGAVYILDGSFGYLYSQSLAMVPKWWKDSFKTV